MDPFHDRVRLERDEVHLWWRRIGMGEGSAAARAWLSDDERRRCERFHREQDARAFAARRVFLRSVLASYLGRRPGELVFESNAWGKPTLVRPAVDLAFNLSRSGERMLLGVTWGRELGVDVERVDPRLRDGEELSTLSARVLTPAERACFSSLPDDERPAAFVRAWARKEAVLKALGTGLSRAPSSVEVGLQPLGPLEARTLDEQVFPRPRGGRLLDVAAPEGFAACVVAEGHDWDLLTCSRAA